jgi:folate-dependent phosphoribosylglycinamide formyltransferase PurN
MTLTPLYDIRNGPMRVIGAMSGSGSNLRKLFEHEDKLKMRHGRSPYEIVAIFTDTPASRDSNAWTIGAERQRSVLFNDKVAFYEARGKPVKDLSIRPEYDSISLDLLAPFKANVIAYAGYMSIASQLLTDAYLGVNVHPADLTRMLNGKRWFTGDKAVAKALLAGERSLRSTTHILTPDVDMGPILMLSAALEVKLDQGTKLFDEETRTRVASEHQSRLKQAGDWVIFPKTLEYIALGRYAKDENGLLHFDGKPIPQGWRIDDGV